MSSDKGIQRKETELKSITVMPTNNSANIDVFHIDCINGLLMEIHEHLKGIVAKTIDQRGYKDAALKALNGLQINELHKLRRVFE